jgi:endonuclease YncB( thermonuclease family)
LVTAIADNGGMKHFRPENVVRGDFRRARPRRWTQAHAYGGGSSAPRRGATGTTVGVVLAAAAFAGMAFGLEQSPQPAASVPDKPILWNETQAVPRGAAAAEDAAWAARGSGEVAAPAHTASAAAAIPFFGYCRYGGGMNCVVDGDTFYLGRDKVRIAGIDAPETHPSRCAEEKRLGEAATDRLRALLNSGAVTVTSIDRDEDFYGRKLRNVAVGGADVGAVLIGEGLARDYAGGRRSWCG